MRGLTGSLILNVASQMVPRCNRRQRAAWLRDTRTALEDQGIGWAVWDYQGSFAVVTKKDGKAEPIPGIADALGLHAQ